MCHLDSFIFSTCRSSAGCLVQKKHQRNEGKEKSLTFDRPLGSVSTSASCPSGRGETDVASVGRGVCRAVAVSTAGLHLDCTGPHVHHDGRGGRGAGPRGRAVSEVQTGADAQGTWGGRVVEARQRTWSLTHETGLWIL